MSGSNPNKVYIAFLPVSGYEADIDYFKIYLVNNTEKPLEFKLQIGPEVHSGEILPFESLLHSTINFDKLNESPDIHLLYAIDNYEDEYYIRVKPKSFFKKLSEIPQLNKKGYIYEIITSHPETMESRSINDNSVSETDMPRPFDIDPQLLKEKMMGGDPEIIKRPLNLDELIIDLHIEKLIPDPSGLSNSEILYIQVTKFIQEIEKAIADGYKKMIVIHGIGKGKLKKEIFRILNEYNQVSSFHNDFDQRFGYGATRIFFQY